MTRTTRTARKIATLTTRIADLTAQLSAVPFGMSEVQTRSMMAQIEGQLNRMTYQRAALLRLPRHGCQKTDATWTVVSVGRVGRKAA